MRQPLYKSIDEMGGASIIPEGFKTPTGELPISEAMPSPSFQLPAWMKAQTGPGSIEDYIHHPLNIKEDRNFAQIIRGLTGMFNTLSYAVIDVVVGGFKFLKKDKPE